MEALTNPPTGRQFDLMTSAQHLRRFAALERRLFEVVGQWVREERHVPAKLQYGQQCYRHVFFPSGQALDNSGPFIGFLGRSSVDCLSHILAHW